MVSPEIRRAERRVLALLRQAERAHQTYTPLQLEQRLARELSDVTVREALWRLLERRLVDVTPTRGVRLNDTSSRYAEVAP